MAMNDYRDVYVSACGRVFESRRSGRDHERFCHACLVEIHNERLEDFEDHDHDEEEEDED